MWPLQWDMMKLALVLLFPNLISPFSALVQQSADVRRLENFKQKSVSLEEELHRLQEQNQEAESKAERTRLLVGRGAEHSLSKEICFEMWFWACICLCVPSWGCQCLRHILWIKALWKWLGCFPLASRYFPVVSEWAQTESNEYNWNFLGHTVLAAVLYSLRDVDRFGCFIQGYDHGGS